ncbi:CpaF family protein [Kineococcus gynurae]|uniref:CpaF family protein n=1 Tax=Kineococcus gynurae TaxID=452979 RepID=A0ABV5LX69_9ACTN
MEAVRQVEAGVRDELRRLISAGNSRPGDEEVRALVQSALTAYDLRSLDGSVPPLLDRERAGREVLAAVSGYGPLQPYFDDPEVEEIWINEPDKVFVARNGRPELTTTILDASTVADLVQRMLSPSGRRVDLSSPFVDATLPDGSRLHVVVPDVTREHWAVNIRRFVARAHRLEDLVVLGSLTAPAAGFLRAAMVAGLNVLVSGGVGAGKTTLLSCLLAAVPPQQRIVSCEEVFELRTGSRDHVALQCRGENLEGRGEIPLRRLVKEALRMRPDRLVVGEVRQAESLDLLIALNSGTPGAATVHANSAADAVAKMCLLPLLAGENVTSPFVVPAVAAAVDLVVHVATSPEGTRRVEEILAVPGRVEAGVVETASVFRRDPVTAELRRGSGWPPHRERFARLGLDLPRILAGAA